MVSFNQGIFSQKINSFDEEAYILKAKKFAEPPIQSKKIAKKVRKSGRHFWAIGVILGHFG